MPEILQTLYVIQFDDDSYNHGPGVKNGFPASFEEATRYPREALVDKLRDLWGVRAILSVGTEESGPAKESEAVVATDLMKEMLPT